MTTERRVRHRQRPQAPDTRPPAAEALDSAAVPAPAEVAASAEEPSEPLPATAAEANYAVGYKRPPQHTRFQPGQSGNPKGRPKGAKGLKTLIAEELGRTITVQENGQRKVVTKAKAAAALFVNKAMQGDAKAMAILLKLADGDDALRRGVASAPPPSAPEPLGEDDLAILTDYKKQLLDLLARQPPADSPTDDVGEIVP